MIAEQSPAALVEIRLDELGDVTGGGFLDLAKGGFGLRYVYHQAVKGITAGIGGYKLANEMYQSKDHDVTWGERWEAMKAMKGIMDKIDDKTGKLPSWAPQW